MCLGIEIARYVKVEAGHPWHGKKDYDIDVDVHGGLTFAERDVPCQKEGPDTGYWVGFDTGHCDDLCDVELIKDPQMRKFWGDHNAEIMGINEEFGMEGRSSVKTTAYVRAECESLARQAFDAMKASGANLV